MCQQTWGLSMEVDLEGGTGVGRIRMGGRASTDIGAS